MIEKEFSDKQTEMLSKIPKAFRGWMSYYAWEVAHAGGYEEVLSHLDSLIEGFCESLTKYDESKLQNDRVT